MNPTVNINRKAEAEAVAEVVKRATQPSFVKFERGDLSADIAFVPAGLEPRSVKKFLDEYRAAPERRQGTASLTDLASFIAHVKRFADADSAIFADKNAAAPCLLAVLDYHRAGADADPRFGVHRARYAFPISDEWKAWTGANARAMGQEDFARFIEDRLADVADPDKAGDGAKAFAGLLSCGFASASKLLELSRGLAVHVGRRVVNHANLATGEGTVSFAEEHSDAQGKPMKVPGAFLLALPVFRNGPLYQVPARLRYRVQGGSVVWSFELYRVEAVFDHAIGEACDTAQRATGLSLFAGTPEA